MRPVSTRPALALLLLAASAAAQQTPTPAAAAWWTQTTALANDSMQGRDTGSEAYERAARYVADQFAHAGLRPAGDNGTWFQRVPMHEVDLDLTHSHVDVLHFQHPGAVGDVPQRTPIQLIQEITLTPSAGQFSYTGGAVFLGYGPASGADLPDPHTLGRKDFQGQAAVVFGGLPAGLPEPDRLAYAARRSKALADAGFALVLSIDNPAALEPFHWPAAYSRSVTLAGTPAPKQPAPINLRISAEAAARLFAHDPAHPYPALLQAAEAGQLLTAFPLTDGLDLALATTQKDISAPNILAILPGSDPALAPEYVALSAHLDGYGFGSPVHGDNLYNGALDDAAYVATLINLAQHLQDRANIPVIAANIDRLAQPRPVAYEAPTVWSERVPGVDPPWTLHTVSFAPLTTQRPRRSILFCIFTGEEKGLLGSQYFTRHPTVPPASIVADLNLDQLRPIFPLRILTMEGLTESTLGETTRTVAARFGIEIRPDREPERNLFRRADNYNFVRIGVPIASFIFGYDPNTPEERIYRDWYATRYHKPQDDLTTPIDWAAAVKFNDFYRALALAIANASTRPDWLPNSPYAPSAKP